MPPPLPDSTALFNYLVQRRYQLGTGYQAHFKFHDDKDEAFLLHAQESEIATSNTTREAVLFFLLAYDKAMVRTSVDDQRWQYWTLELDALDQNETFPQVLSALNIAKVVEASSIQPVGRRRR